MSAQAQARRQKTFAPRVAPPVVARSRKTRPGREPAFAVVDPSHWSPSDSGRPLEPEVRRRLEAALHRPLGHVRVHTQPFDRARVHAIGARAFAHRHHIWLGAHESPSDVALLAHEVTHVVQQGFAPQVAGVAAAPTPLVPAGPVMAPALAGAHAGHGAARAAAAAPAPPVAAVQRLDLDLLGRARRAAGAVGSGIRSAGRAVVGGARAVGGAVVAAGGELLNMGRDALIALVRTRWPDFARILERDGITGFIRNLVERGIRAMFNGLLAPLRTIFNFDALASRVGQAVGWMSSIAGQLARGDCSGILSAARQVRQFFSSALQPVFDKIRSISDKVTGFFRGIWQQIGAPIMDLLRGIGGRIWESLRNFMRDVGAVIRRVREAVGSAWDRVKEYFGVKAESGEEEGGGIWNWIKDKAVAVGESISNVIRPVVGPLRSVAGVLLLIVPGGQILAVILLWPRLRQAWDWLSQRWTELNLIPRARHFLANTVLPALMNAAESVGQAVVNAADWLLGLISRVASIVATAAEAATGILVPLGRVIRFAHQQFQRIVTWARGGLRSASRNMRSLLQRLIRFLGIVLDALKQLIAIVVNPFGITGFLLGTIWRLIPDCLKGPIIDFILELLIRLLRALPPMPQLGFLWPLIKSAALGFLERVLGFALQRKVNVSNKMARIISGMSPSFAFGYLRGLGLGLWDEITGPFQALAALFELPTLIQNFLSSLGVRLCELIDKIRCFATTLAGKVFGTLDDILSGLSELFSDPSRILDLIQCAIEGALAAAASLGSSIADRLMAVFESADDAIGEQMGRITASVVVQAVIAYFTAGVGTSVGIVRQVANALRTVGRAVNQVLGMLRGLFGRLVGAVRGLASRLARGAASGGRSVLGRIGGFFRGVANWFGRLLGRIGRRVARHVRLNPRQIAQWRAFRAAVSAMAAQHAGRGVTRQNLARQYRGILSRFRSVAKAPAFITKHRGFWRLWVRKVRRPLPGKIARARQDHESLWREAAAAVRRRMRRTRSSQRTEGTLDRILNGMQRRYRFTMLDAQTDHEELDFDIIGAMSPRRKITQVPQNFGTPANPITLRYPKRASSRYPTLYFGPRVGASGPFISQSTLRSARTSTPRKRAIGRTLPGDRNAAWVAAGMPIEEYRPHSRKALPLGGRAIGVAGNWRTSRGKLLKLEPGATTPGGGRMNRLLRLYGYSPSTEGADGDHVVEIQLGGQDEVPNLWPLDSSENRSAGSTLASMSFRTPAGSNVNMDRLKTLARRRQIWFRISSTR